MNSDLLHHIILNIIANHKGDSVSEQATQVVHFVSQFLVDGRRLDWLEENVIAQHSEYVSIRKLGKHYNGFPKSLRAAIDATMKEDK